MRVAVSPIDGERYMMDDVYSLDEFHAKDIVAHKKQIDADAAHAQWMREAKASDPRDVRDEVILADARRHLDAARTWPLPVGNGESALDSRWSEWSQSFYEETKKFTTCRDVLHYAQVNIPFDHRAEIKDHKAEFLIYEKLVSEEFPFFVEKQMKFYDNAKSIPETLYNMHGRLVSNVFYWHLRTMFRIQEDISPLNSILEIGGGYGSLARLWMLNDVVKIKRYVIVDLPESLFYSEVCLREEFGDQVGYWEGSDPLTRIVLLPIGRLQEYEAKSDLVINVGSMQEMSDAWVSFYMGWLDQTKPKFFYSLNYMGQAITALYESRTFWAPRMSKDWITRLLNPDVPLVKMMCSGRDFVEVIYEYAQPMRKFSEWSCLKGCFFNRATYLEGLELLRQDLTTDNAMAFLAYVTVNHDKKRLICPKEVLFIASLIFDRTNNPNLKILVDKLAGAQKIGVY